jgi:hypothetical protein
MRIPKSSSRSVLRRSQPLDGFLRFVACEFISSRSQVQDHFLFRGFPLFTAALSHRKCVPPRRCSKAHSPASRLPRTKLLDLEALLREEPRASGSVINLAVSRSPLQVTSLLQALFSSPELVPQLRTLMTFEVTRRPPCKHDMERQQPAFSVFATRSLTVSSPKQSACSSF